MRQQLAAMLELQNAINTRIHADWRGRNLKWHRAIWIECAELLDHFGWKWWKKQSSDMRQVRLELIDIWHFGLSLLLQQGTALAVIEQQLNRGLKRSATTDFCDDVEIFAGHVLAEKSFNIEYFGRLMAAVELDFETLYTDYVSKNILNIFRQDHGYKEGTYQKIWQGREDNEHLIDIIAMLDVDADNFQDQLYYQLAARYQACL